MADLQNPIIDHEEEEEEEEEEDIFLSIFSHAQIRNRYDKLIVGKRYLGQHHRGHYLALACVEYHKDFRRKTNQSHRCEILECELLYEAARLAFDTRLDTDSVEILLREMYHCENSFRELIFPSPSLHMFDLIEENLSTRLWIDNAQKRETHRFEMLAYFIEQATKRKIMFQVKGTLLQFRLQDCPLDRLYIEFSPIEEAIENEESEILEYLLRYGAKTEFKNMFLRRRSAVSLVLDFLYSHHAKKQAFCSVPMVMTYKRCLKLILRAVLQVRYPNVGQTEFNPFLKDLELPEKEAYFEHAISSGLIPASRGGHAPPELKHQCRIKIRQVLSDNWQLPRGIYEMQLPRCLEKYLDLQED